MSTTTYSKFWSWKVKTEFIKTHLAPILDMEPTLVLLVYSVMYEYSYFSLHKYWWAWLWGTAPYSTGNDAACTCIFITLLKSKSSVEFSSIHSLCHSTLSNDEPEWSFSPFQTKWLNVETVQACQNPLSGLAASLMRPFSMGCHPPAPCLHVLWVLANRRASKSRESRHFSEKGNFLGLWCVLCPFRRYSISQVPPWRCFPLPSFHVHLVILQIKLVFTTDSRFLNFYVKLKKEITELCW